MQLLDPDKSLPFWGDNPDLFRQHLIKALDSFHGVLLGKEFEEFPDQQQRDKARRCVKVVIYAADKHRVNTIEERCEDSD